MANKAPFVIDPARTAIAMAYSNSGMIADSVLPRTPVGTSNFKYLVYNKDEKFTLPDTRIGRTSRPNEVEFGATELDGSVKDYGLEDPVPQADIDNAPANYDPLNNATEGVSELIMLGREKRVSDVVFNAATYPAANKQTLSGTSQWSDFANSDPVAAILAAIDSMLMRPNVMVLGQAVFTKLRTHPLIVKAINGNSGDSGIVMRQALADLFEMDEVLVGQGWINNAKLGQTASFGRLWGKHCALLRRDMTATTRRGITFGVTATFGTRVAMTRPDPDIGLRGGTRVRVGESVDELITASDAGYFFENAVA